jgi:Fe-Mn family superoxide dismutase
VTEALGGAAEGRLAEGTILVAQAKTYPLAGESLDGETKKGHLEVYRGLVQAFNALSARAEGEEIRRKEGNSIHSEHRSVMTDSAYAANGVYLHELYFANCFDPRSTIYSDSLFLMRMERDFGSFDAWQRSFLAAALSAREGWAVTVYSEYLKKYVDAVIDGNDAGVLFGSHPVLVLDMWTHARGRWGADRRGYAESQLREVNWDVVEDRVQRIERNEAAK